MAKQYNVTKPDNKFPDIILYYWGTKDGKIETFCNLESAATKLNFNQALKVAKREKQRIIKLIIKK